MFNEHDLPDFQFPVLQTQESNQNQEYNLQTQNPILKSPNQNYHTVEKNIKFQDNQIIRISQITNVEKEIPVPSNKQFKRATTEYVQYLPEIPSEETQNTTSNELHRNSNFRRNLNNFNQRSRRLIYSFI
ncbi:hypothetical protein PPERSA_04054 [Pseudocohnilembus persalinus]|uniref:Uncharacterized protein n=1 Tax=Pseudocohnilembus persalinus TaxID=266149 RepID=A0A0V0QKP0_PSEPJ|nr:hypothetical protein PPERSA_04054 [Pseudocohnilembus persalinus]|eukprot:KRX02851.1 hypothetical protein PPERSA_04054 [Pseudocohnilembus persalinus]